MSAGIHERGGASMSTGPRRWPTGAANTVAGSSSPRPTWSSTATELVSRRDEPSPILEYGRTKAGGRDHRSERNPRAWSCGSACSSVRRESVAARSSTAPSPGSRQDSLRPSSRTNSGRRWTTAQRPGGSFVWRTSETCRASSIVAGRERLSRFEFMRRTAAALGLDPALVRANRRADVATGRAAAGRPLAEYRSARQRCFPTWIARRSNRFSRMSRSDHAAINSGGPSRRRIADAGMPARMSPRPTRDGTSVCSSNSMLPRSTSAATT